MTGPRKLSEYFASKYTVFRYNNPIYKNHKAQKMLEMEIS